MEKMAKQYWLMKTEPETFSIDDLKSRPDQTESWDGVRNYQARNSMRDLMRIGDGVLFYHSSTLPPGVAGEAVIASGPLPDPTALDAKSLYFDPKATPMKNPWVMVRVRFVRKFKSLVTLQSLRETPGLEEMQLLRRGMRLSIQPVTPEEYRIVIARSKA
jgi:predicted RNA-binding protein with PUA-like domain